VALRFVSSLWVRSTLSSHAGRRDALSLKARRSAIRSRASRSRVDFTIARVIGRRWLPPILWATLILALDSVPHPERFVPSMFPGSDKLAHLGMYGMLGLLLARAMFASMTKAAIAGVVTVLIVATLGAGDELHQLLVPARSASAADWLADVSGATVGVLFVHAARRRRETTS
jgi:VanZ family protein